MLACCGQVLQPTTRVDRVSGRVRPAAAVAAAVAASSQTPADVQLFYDDLT